MYFFVDWTEVLLLIVVVFYAMHFGIGFSLKGYIL